MARVCDRCREVTKENEARFEVSVVLPPVAMCEPPHPTVVTFAVSPHADDRDTCANCAIEAFTVAFDHLMALYGGQCASCHDRGKVGAECLRCKECRYIPVPLPKESHGQEESPSAQAVDSADNNETFKAVADFAARQQARTIREDRNKG